MAEQNNQQGGGGGGLTSLTNLIMFAGAIVVFLVVTGHVTKEELMDLFAGSVQIGETVQKFDEGEFMAKFDVIVGEVEVNDTSSTEFKRSSAWCEKAYVITTTHATIKYEVESDSNFFQIDHEAKTYFISPTLGVGFHEADKESNTEIQESNCVKERHIGQEGVKEAQRLATENFKNAILSSDKILQAQIEFKMIKDELIKSLQEAGFKEQKPKTVFQD